jgi:DNA (cytosine-5)-methyltransferase 1
MKFIELFAGIGGFRLGLERAGHECVWANEIQPKASSIYEYNFKHQPDGRDIRTIDPNEIPQADLLCGGFPCATFSVAGKREGFGSDDTRGTLFFEICRIARHKRIPYLFLENVKGLLNHDGGRTFAIIVASLDELGYDVQWECVNSKNFGVPQNRERVFIIANLRGQPRPQVFPLGRCGGGDGDALQNKGSGICEPYLPTLDAHYNQVGGGGRAYIDEDGVEPPNGLVRTVQWRRTYLRENNNDHVPTLLANMGTGGNNVPLVVKPVLTPDRGEKRQNGRRIKEDGEPSFTLTAQDRHGVMVDTSIRKLTPLECERLQSLPDNWTKWYKDGSLVPDSQRYERCGRAVTINVIYEIAKRLPL